MIENFKVTTNGIDDYIGYVLLSDVQEPMFSALAQGAYTVDINGLTYARVGMYHKNFGTLLSMADFQPYYDAYMDVLLTQEEYKQIIKENEDEVQ